ncbi:MAG: hypothetical protein KF690_08410 [Bacteroidetes bacterium]|nr:hypothetical protein [Bacteroidota bacterium]
MRSVTVYMPEERFSFFLELMSQMGFEAIPDQEVSEDTPVPQGAQQLVRERMAALEESRCLPWKTVYAQLKARRSGI